MEKCEKLLNSGVSAMGNCGELLNSGVSAVGKMWRICETVVFQQWGSLALLEARSSFLGRPFLSSRIYKNQL